MRLFPHAIVKCRTNILLFVFIADRCNFIAHIIIVIIIFIAASIIIYQLFSFKVLQNSWLMKSMLFFETIIFIHNTLLLLQCAILLTDSMISTYIIFHNTVKQLNENFIAILKNCLHRNTKISLYEKMKIQFIHRQHNRLAYYLKFTNEDIWSKTFYHFALVSIPINVSIMSELLVENLPIQTQLLFIFVAIIHAISLLVPFMSLAKVSDDFHQIKNQIPSLQFRLKHNQHLRLKLKYDDLYERLMFGRKICYTFGYLGNLTFRGLFEAFLYYIMAFFLVLRFYFESHN
ncbi:uncharacterized protein LOC113797018 [Dermatophagoides pteronyssinus]|uniref:uncharacterized protein LOC113797018 n=1 Tax=Dermatophagoides pteronyssinus TaxID=6956 RepID=UPI003F674490